MKTSTTQVRYRVLSAKIQVFRDSKEGVRLEHYLLDSSVHLGYTSSSQSRSELL